MRHSLIPVLPAFLAAFMCAATECRGDELLTIDGETVTGMVNSIADGQVIVDVTKDDATESQNISLGDLRSIRLIPELFGKDSKIELLIDNRRTDEHKAGEEHEASVKIKLRKGHQAFTLVYWQKDEPAKLSMEVAGPDGEFAAITPEVLFRVSESVEIEPSSGKDDEGFYLSAKGEGFESGVYYEVRDLGDRPITSLADLRGVPQTSSGGHRMLDLSMKHPDRNFAVILRGYFLIQEDGEYGAKLKSTGNSQLFIGRTPPALRPSTVEKSEGLWQIGFRDGGRVRGQLESWEENHCLVKYQIEKQSHELSVPGIELTELWPATSKPEEMKSEREDEPSDLDSVYAKGKGDRIQRVSGTVLGIADKALRFEYKEQERTISMDRIVGIVMRKVDRPEADLLLVAHRLEFLTDLTVPGQLADISGEKVTFRLPWGETLEARRDDVCELVIAKGRFQSLSEIEPMQVTQTPFFDRVIPMTFDKSLTGAKLQIGEKLYEKGLCLPSRTELSYDLDGEFDRFRCKLGLQEIDGDDGNAAIKVMADGDVLLAIDELSGGQEPQEVDLDVSGRQRLTLLVDFGKNLNIGDHVVWANAHLLRNEEIP